MPYSYMRTYAMGYLMYLAADTKYLTLPTSFNAYREEYIAHINQSLCRPVGGIRSTGYGVYPVKKLIVLIIRPA
jgi:hypothetical protein